MTGPKVPTTARGAGRVVTCDQEWMAHGGGAAELPADVASLAEAKSLADAHAKKMGKRHASVRIWKFDRDYKTSLEPSAQSK